MLPASCCYQAQLEDAHCKKAGKERGQPIRGLEHRAKTYLATRLASNDGSLNPANYLTVCLSTSIRAIPLLSALFRFRYTQPEPMARGMLGRTRVRQYCSMCGFISWRPSSVRRYSTSGTMGIMRHPMHPAVSYNAYNSQMALRLRQQGERRGASSRLRATDPSNTLLCVGVRKTEVHAQGLQRNMGVPE